MKQVVICSPTWTHTIGPAIVVNEFKMDGLTIAAALLETDDIELDMNNPDHNNKVLIRKEGFSLNYRDKSLIIKSSKFCQDQKDRHFYFPIGSDFIGTIEQVGKEVPYLKVGDRVIGNGSYPYTECSEAAAGLPTNKASKELELFHYAKVLKVPHEMPMEVGASFTIGGQTTNSIIRRAQLQGGEHVLITSGTSNTSLFAIAALSGLNVITHVLTTSINCVDRLHQLGADYVYVLGEDRQLRRNAKLKETVKAIHGFDLVIDPFYDLYLGQVVQLMKAQGKYFTCGLFDQYLNDTGGKLVTPPNHYDHIMSMVITRNISLMGNCLGSTEDLQAAVDRFANKQFDVAIDSVFSGNDLEGFFNRTFNARDRFGKVAYQYAPVKIKSPLIKSNAYVNDDKPV